MRFTYTVSYVPGKDLILADTLSRAPIRSSTLKDKVFGEEVEAFVDLVMNNLPATERRLEKFGKRKKRTKSVVQSSDTARKYSPQEAMLKEGLNLIFP